MNDQTALNYSFRQYLLPIDPSELGTSRRRNQKINENVLQAIGDQSLPLCELSTIGRIIDLYKRVGIAIRPDNPFLLMWNFIILSIVVFYILEIGFIAGFGEDFLTDSRTTLLPLHVIVILVLIIDMLFAPLKAFYDEGLLITSIPTIFRHYFRVQIWVDSIGLLCIIIPLLLGTFESNYIKVLWLFKLYTAGKINRQFQRVTQLHIRLNIAYLVLKLVAMYYFFAHFTGIGFYMVSQWVYIHNYYGPNTPNLCWVYNSWALYQMAIFLTWTQMYTYIMYYSIAVVTTIAYGDITPKNPIQCIYTIFTLISQTILFGYVMAEIIRLLITIFAYNFQRRFVYLQLLTKLKNEKVQQQVQIQVRAHTQEIDREQRFRNRNIQQKIINLLPPEPLYGLLETIYEDFLNQIGFQFFLGMKKFKLAQAKSLFLEQFMRQITQHRHYIGDIFYQCGELQNSTQDNHCVYYFTKKSYSKSVALGAGKTPILKNGKFQTNNKNQNCFQLAYAQKIFGKAEFLTGKPRSHWAICIQNSVVFAAKRNSLLHHYSMLTNEQKQIVYSEMEHSEDQFCLICNEDHCFLRCPYSFVRSSTNLFQNDRPVLRRKNKLKKNRSRLKTLSPWVIHKSLKTVKYSVTKQYKDRLLSNKTTQSLFVEYELQIEQTIETIEQFQTELMETQVMIEKIHDDILQQYGSKFSAMNYDRIRSYPLYKPHNNLEQIVSSMNRKSRRIANVHEHAPRR